MRMCQHHWDLIRAAIDARGLTQFVKTPEQLRAMMENPDVEPSAETFEPLMGVNNMILDHGLKLFGIALMQPTQEGGHLCPICVAMTSLRDLVIPELGRARTAEEEERYWIDGPSDLALGEARRLGLMGSLQ